MLDDAHFAALASLMVDGCKWGLGCLCTHVKFSVLMMYVGTWIPSVATNSECT